MAGRATTGRRDGSNTFADGFPHRRIGWSEKHDTGATRGGCQMGNTRIIADIRKALLENIDKRG